MIELNNEARELLTNLVEYYKSQYDILVQEEDPSIIRKIAYVNYIDCGICHCIKRLFVKNDYVYINTNFDWIKKANPNKGSEYWYDTIAWNGVMTKEEMLKCISTRIDIMENLLTQQI